MAETGNDSGWREVEDRFRLADPNHEAVRTLYELALDREPLKCNPGVNLVREKGEDSFVKDSERRAFSPLRPMELLLTEIRIPAVPRVMLELLQVINNPKSSARDVAEVIGMDTALSSHLLRTVNSAYYTFPFPIDTVTRAVALMGTREISLMAFSASFVKLFNRAPKGFLDLESFWKHSFACGIASRIIALRCGRPNPERHFLAGILHDLGRLVLAGHFPEMTKDLFEKGREGNLPPYEVEMEMLGFDHGRFGGALLRKWNFPSTLIAAVGDHHRPERISDTYDEPLTVHLSDIIVKSLAIGSSGDRRVPPLNPLCWRDLQLLPQDLIEIVDEMEGRLESLTPLLVKF